jgi:hypothetical protein
MKTSTRIFQQVVHRLLGEKLIGTLDFYFRPKLRDRWGSYLNGQEGRKAIFLQLMDTFDFSVIIETGTFRGSTTGYFHESSGLPVYSVENNERFCEYARLRHKRSPNIHISLGDSRQFLRDLIAQETIDMTQPVLIYLDAHWYNDLPLREELNLIYHAWPEAVVLVDDFAVPGDEGYGFDDYGVGKALTLELLKEQKLPGLSAFFPSLPSDLETGAKKGCVVLATSAQANGRLKEFTTLVQHDL